MSRSRIKVENEPKFNSTNWNLQQEHRELTKKEEEFKLANTKKTGSSTNNKTRQSYMAQPNVKAFNREFVSKALVGRPYRWNSVEELGKEISEYFDLCERTDTVPTITAIATWLHCNKDTIYAHANNSASPFSDLLKTVINICHTSLENGAIDGKVNSVVYIFMGKNYFSLEDSKQITVTPTTNNNQINTQETMDAIQKQIEEENVPNAKVIEK